MADKDLLDVWLRNACYTADGVGINRRIPPAEDAEPLLADDSLENSLADEALMSFDRKEHHPDAIFSRQRQGKSEACTFTVEERMRDLDRETRTIPGLRITAAGTAVCKVEKYLDSLENNVVGLLPFDVYNEADAARIPFE
jgi:hypothetical protein